MGATRSQTRLKQLSTDAWGEVLVPPEGTCITVSLSCFTELKAPTSERCQYSSFQRRSQFENLKKLMRRTTQAKRKIKPRPAHTLILINAALEQHVSHSVISDSVTPWTQPATARLLSMGFPRQEYRSGLPFPSPGDLPNRGTETRSPPLQSESLSSELRRLRPVLELVLKNSSPNPAGLSETQSFERHKHAVFPSSPGKAIKLLFLLHSKPCL